MHLAHTVQRKSELTLRDWHDMVERFATIEHLKFKPFPKEFLAASSATFQIGYLEPPKQPKKMAVRCEGYHKMYASFPSGSQLIKPK